MARGAFQDCFDAIPPLKLLYNPLPALIAERIAELFSADQLIQGFEYCINVLRIHQQAGYTIDHSVPYAARVASNNRLAASVGFQVYDSEAFLTEFALKFLAGHDKDIARMQPRDYLLIRRPAQKVNRAGDAKLFGQNREAGAAGSVADNHVSGEWVLGENSRQH